MLTSYNANIILKKKTSLQKQKKPMITIKFPADRNLSLSESDEYIRLVSNAHIPSLTDPMHPLRSPLSVVLTHTARISHRTLIIGPGAAITSFLCSSLAKSRFLFHAS